MRLVLVLLAAHLLASGEGPINEYEPRPCVLADAHQSAGPNFHQQACAATSDSRIISNIARAYDQAGREEEAISYYEKYLTDGESAQLRKRSRSAIDRLRLQKEKAAAERKRPRAEAERVAARRAEEANQQRLKVAYEETRASRERMRVTSFALGGVALASAGVGAFFGLKAHGSRTDFDTATALDLKLAAKSATRSSALLADIGFGVGVAGVVAAILLYPKESVAQPGKARLTAAPQGTGAGLEVSF